MQKQFLYILLILSNAVFGQNYECGTQATADPHFDRSNYDQFLSIRNAQEIDTIPVFVHIIRQSNGLGGIAFETIENEIYKVNLRYLGSNVHFSLCSNPNYIDYDPYYNLDWEVYEKDLEHIYNKDGFINIYFAGSLTFGESDLCGIANFPWYDQDLIGMRNSCVENGSTLAHELGHYFGLYHTHETYLGEELVARLNCTTAGDMLCDTPADPKLSSENVTSGCTYFGNEKDFSGSFYDPQTTNLMSYAPSHCRSLFTNEQLARINYYNLNSKRVNLKNKNEATDLDLLNFTISETWTSGSEPLFVDLDYTINYKDHNSPFKVGIYLSADQVIDKDDIIIYEKDNFAIAVGEIVSIKDTLTLPYDIRSGAQYVLAKIDKNDLIFERSKKNNQAEIKITVDKSLLGSYNIYPNPSSDVIRVYYKLPKGGAVQTQVIDETGKVVINRDFRYSTVELHFEENISKLAPGIYFYRIVFDKRSYTQRFIKM